MTHFLEVLPFQGVLLLLSALFPIHFGHRVGSRAMRKSGEMLDAPMGTVVGAAAPHVRGSNALLDRCSRSVCSPC